jgi:hypothetical protein
MSVEDLAADVGIVKGTDEFQSFCGSVENILNYGCGYSDMFTEELLEKCRHSELDIAKQVIRELSKPRERYRRNKLKWWQEYVPKRLPAHAKTRDNHTERRPQRQIMDLQFDEKRQKKEMDLHFVNRRRVRRREYREEPVNCERKTYRSRSRSRSPRNISKYSDVPEWTERPQKRKRFRR